MSTLTNLLTVLLIIIPKYFKFRIDNVTTTWKIDWTESLTTCMCWYSKHDYSNCCRFCKGHISQGRIHELKNRRSRWLTKKRSTGSCYWAVISFHFNHLFQKKRVWRPGSVFVDIVTQMIHSSTLATWELYMYMEFIKLKITFQQYK